MDRSIQAFLKEKGIEFKENIGSGSYGSVFKGYSTRLGEHVAIKRVNEKGTKSLIRNEINIMQKCKSQFTVRYYDNFEINGVTFIVMEHCSKGSLEDLMSKGEKCFDEEKSSNFLAQTLLALEVLHDRKIIHRDLKPSNIFLINDFPPRIKLGDFGISSPCEIVQERAGTGFFMAPEIGKCKYDNKVDIYSLGRMAIYLVEGLEAGHGLNASRSETYKDFVLQCTQSDPCQRPTVRELKKHNLVKKYVEQCEKEMDSKCWKQLSSDFDTIQSIIINDQSYIETNAISICNYPSLKEIKIGKYCFRDVTSFDVQNCQSLQIIHVGKHSFKAQESNFGFFRLSNCLKLQQFATGILSFQKFNDIRFLNLPNLHTISVANGVFEGDENQHNSLTLESSYLDFVTQRTYIPYKLYCG